MKNKIIEKYGLAFWNYIKDYSVIAIVKDGLLDYNFQQFMKSR